MGKLSTRCNSNCDDKSKIFGKARQKRKPIEDPRQNSPFFHMKRILEESGLRGNVKNSKKMSNLKKLAKLKTSLPASKDLAESLPITRAWCKSETRNLAVVRKLALHALLKEISLKRGLATKQCAAAYNPAYRSKVIKHLF